MAARPRGAVSPGLRWLLSPSWCRPPITPGFCDAGDMASVWASAVHPVLGLFTPPFLSGRTPWQYGCRLAPFGGGYICFGRTWYIYFMLLNLSPSFILPLPLSLFPIPTWSALGLFRVNTLCISPDSRAHKASSPQEFLLTPPRLAGDGAHPPDLLRE